MSKDTTIILLLICNIILFFQSIRCLSLSRKSLMICDKFARLCVLKDAYLQMIRDKCVDYDGWKDYKGLKNLVDEVDEYAKLALTNNDTEVCYIGPNGEEYNILDEEIKEGEDNE